MLLHTNVLWNVLMHPHVLHPALASTTAVWPSEAQFHNLTNFGFRPINNGMGGSGVEFSESIGGSMPKEQFTGEQHCGCCMLLLLMCLRVQCIQW